MNAGHTVRSDTKHPASSHVSTRLWNLPAYGKPLRNAPSHSPWKTPPIHRPRFPQLPQPLPLEEKKPEPDEDQAPIINPTLISPGTKTGSTPHLYLYRAISSSRSRA